MSISKSNARRLAKNGLELGARVLRGVLVEGPDGLEIDKKKVAEWLAQHADSELILIAAPIDRGNFDGQVRSCYTCGRDYKGDECSYCAEVRARLRQ